MDDALKAKLEALDAEFKDAPTGFDNLPEDGTYQALLKSIDTFEGKQDSTSYLKLVFEVAHDPKYKGTEIDKVYTWIPDPYMPEEQKAKRLGAFKKDLQTLGIDTNSEDFSYTAVYPGSSFWDDLLDVPVELAIKRSERINEKTGMPFVNVWLNERLGASLGSDIPSDLPKVETVATPGEDPIPF